jgi:hypothetical protein
LDTHNGEVNIVEMMKRQEDEEEARIALEVLHPTMGVHKGAQRVHMLSRTWDPAVEI